jgi:hypothetical protein
VPNWLENDAAADPMDLKSADVAVAVSLLYPKEEGEKDVKGDGDDSDVALPDPADAPKMARVPVTEETIANVGA